MWLFCLAFAGAAVAWSGDDSLPYLHDPILYPAEVLPDDEVTSGEIRVQQGENLSTLVLEHTSVVAEVSAGMARVTLIQWYHNPFDEPLEAVYLFPLPSGAAVDRMDLTCGDRLVAGRIMERDAARRAYEEARDDGRKAALLEQERDNLFTQSIAGLCPGEEVQITLQYVEQVAYEDGLYTLNFPMTVGPRFSPPWVEDAARLDTPLSADPDLVQAVDITVYIDEGVPLDALWSDSHDIVVEDEGAWGAEVALAAEVAPDRDFSLTWSLAGEQPRAAALAHRPDAEEPGYIAVTIEPQILGDLFQPRPRELLFVIDSSGSMAGTPYELARASVLMCLDRMGPQDTFNLVRFSDAASSLFERPQHASATTRAQARDWLSNFDGGGTEMLQGVLHSLHLPGDPEALRLVLMLTDGYVGDETAIFEAVRDNRGAARLFSLGVSSSPNRYLLEGLAEMGRGDVIYQMSGKSMADTVTEFYERIAHPAMSDITINWGGLVVTEQYPTRIPDLWAGQPIRVVARYETDGDPDQAMAQDTGDALDLGTTSTTITVQGTVGTAHYTQQVTLSLPDRELGNEALANLWARRKIHDLEWFPRGRTAAQVRQAVTDVALDHGLVSRYTSLVAIDDEPSRCAEAWRSMQVPNALPDGVSAAFATLGSYGTGGGGGSGYGYGSATFSGGKSVMSSGLMGAKGVQIGGGGLGSRGSGLGGGGSASGLGGLGTMGRGSGASGYGYGGGQLAAKSSAGIGTIGGDPIILGSMDRTLIEAVIRRHLNQIRYCYQRELQKDPNLQGKVVVKFIIAPDGSVSAADIKSSTLANTAVEQCLLQRFLRMQFPAAKGGGIVIVSYPLLFSNGQ